MSICRQLIWGLKWWPSSSSAGSVWAGCCCVDCASCSLSSASFFLIYELLASISVPSLTYMNPQKRHQNSSPRCSARDVKIESSPSRCICGSYVDEEEESLNAYFARPRRGSLLYQRVEMLERGVVPNRRQPTDDHDDDITRSEAYGRKVPSHIKVIHHSTTKNFINKCNSTKFFQLASWIIGSDSSSSPPLQSDGHPSDYIAQYLIASL